MDNRFDTSYKSKDEFFRMFDGMTIEQLKYVVNESEFDLRFDDNAEDFWEWCSERFSGDMREFMIVSHDCDNPDAECYLFDGEDHNDIEWFFTEEEQTMRDSMIDHLWYAVTDHYIHNKSGGLNLIKQAIEESKNMFSEEE